jgi:toxin ParE1/3/4
MPHAAAFAADWSGDKPAASHPPSAVEEAEAATDRYARRSIRAAEMFLDDLEVAVESIVRNPQQYPAYDFDTRRIVLRRFPFLIVFRETASGVEIVAIAHGSRRPNYWRDRFG